jgi:large subunit ribosomal protein L1
MQKRSKSYQSAIASFDKKQHFALEDGVAQVLKLKRAKFEESVELHLVMNLKGTKGPQSIRGTVALPKPVAKEVKVAVFTNNESEATAAKEAGADIIGGPELIDQVKKDGGLEADVVISTPEFMRSLAPVAKILGPKGLMPSPKNGTVTGDISSAVAEFKAGKSEFRMDKHGSIHVAVGKETFTPEEIVANVRVLVTEIEKQKPEKVKGEFVAKAFLTLTQSPSVRIKL